MLHRFQTKAKEYGNNRHFRVSRGEQLRSGDMQVPHLPQLSAIINRYFLELDASLEKLSHKAETFIPNLPSWALCHRNISIGHVLGTEFYIIKTIPDEDQDEDKIFLIDIATGNEFKSFLPFSLIGNREKPFHDGISFAE